MSDLDGRDVVLMTDPIDVETLGRKALRLHTRSGKVYKLRADPINGSDYAYLQMEEIDE